MTDLHLLDEFTRHCTRTYAAEITTTVSSASGLRLTFADNIEATANTWECALVEFLDGDCAGLVFVIAESNIDNVIVTSPFFSRKPATGDAVRVYGGPLGEARIFNEDPETIKEAVENGVKFFMTAAVLAGGVAWRGLGGRSHKGVESTQRIYGVEVTVETKHLTGIPTETDMYAQFIALPLLKEQVVFLIQTFRVDAQNRMSGEGNIEWTKGFIQRPGHATMRGYVINYDVVVN